MSESARYEEGSQNDPNSPSKKDVLSFIPEEEQSALRRHSAFNSSKGSNKDASSTRLNPKMDSPDLNYRVRQFNTTNKVTHICLHLT